MFKSSKKKFFERDFSIHLVDEYYYAPNNSSELSKLKRNLSEEERRSLSRAIEEADFETIEKLAVRMTEADKLYVNFLEYEVFRSKNPLNTLKIFLEKSKISCNLDSLFMNAAKTFDTEVIDYLYNNSYSRAVDAALLHLAKELADDTSFRNEDPYREKTILHLLKYNPNIEMLDGSFIRFLEKAYKQNFSDLILKIKHSTKTVNFIEDRDLKRKITAQLLKKKNRRL